MVSLLKTLRLPHPSLNAAIIGFEELAQRIADAASLPPQSYPPHNIEKVSEEQFRITLAVAGFSAENIEVTQRGQTLTIEGKVSEEMNVESQSKMLHRGISQRPFLKRFVLNEHILVEDVSLSGGLLEISLKSKVPEEAKPRRIEIRSAA